MVREDASTEFSDLTYAEAVFDSLKANIAIVDPHGEILSVNASWRNFAKDNQMQDVTTGVGANYFDVCRSASVDPNARAALDGILEVVDGVRSSFYHEYPCHSPDKKRWFALRATPLVDYPNLVVVSHEDITERVCAEKAARSKPMH